MMVVGDLGGVPPRRPFTPTTMGNALILIMYLHAPNCTAFVWGCSSVCFYVVFEINRTVN